MPPLFVSYYGNREGRPSQGWVVLNHDEPITSGDHLLALVAFLERNQQYDAGSMVLLNFRRLETEGVVVPWR